MRRRLGTTLAAIAVAALAAPRADALQTFGNGFYTVHVSDSDGASDGSWNAITAASHPTGAGDNLLYSNDIVSTNFSSLRVYGPTGTTQTYSFAGAGGGTNMDTYVTGSGASSFGTGWQTQWNITPASLSVAQDVFVVGTTYANSAIYHTVQITNNGNDAVSIGWRNLYDWTVNDPSFDDGPSNQLQLLDGTVVVPTTTTEFTHAPVTADYVRVTAAPPPPGGATYEPLLGLLYDPGLSSLATTAPDVYAYVSWPLSFGTAFDYTPTGQNATGDSAGLSWWGRTADSAWTIAAGSSVRFTETLFGVPGGEPPGPGTVVPEPGTIILLGSGLLGVAGLGRRRQKKS
jgi:hypothetical protein